MAENFEEYSELSDTGYQGGGSEPVTPEEEFFHSIYFAKEPRKNHVGIIEESGKMQVRGVQYNLDEVYMVITHTKDILAKIKTIKSRDTIECFSFKDGAPPWYGTTKLTSGEPRPCPLTSAERAANDFCNPCRAQIIVAGIFCNSSGSPVLTEDKKPIFVFIRGKGMRYKNVSDYLNDLYNEELSPIFQPVTDQSKEFEKKVVNNKRFITKLTRDIEKSSYGSSVNIFVLTKGAQLPDAAVMKILKLSKETKAKFNEKFDWSKSKRASSPTGYGDGEEQTPPDKPEGILNMDEGGQTQAKTEEKPKDAKTFSFDDIEF